ncbi:hypothetical protein [Solicola sp. PLA-1-18]|uniref:hypothetical protein n=1 Tax=Solicola sp. PLA-1-18 TaxID=3380532 RepID=UPI003B81650A
MASKQLRAVAEGETAARRVPRSITEAVKDGTTLDLLLAMRVRLAAALDDPNMRGADLAALSRRMLETAKEIETFEQRDAVDDQTPIADDRFDASAV